MRHFLIMGTVLGLSAGLAPGPLLALVITETLRHDVRAGVKTALAPVITDLPIVIVTLLILPRLADSRHILGVISLLGGCFILLMGARSLRAREPNLDPGEARTRSLTKGVLANALSPHPYLFWLTVGAPAMGRAMSHSVAAPLAFVVSFYAFLVGSKVALAVLAGRSRSLLRSSGYRYTLRILGVLLCALAIVLFRDGLELLSAP